LAEYNAGQFDQYRSPADEYSKHLQVRVYARCNRSINSFAYTLLKLPRACGAARREERYSAMRLGELHQAQIAFFASIDAVASALVGALLGIGIFLLLQP